MIEKGPHLDTVEVIDEEPRLTERLNETLTDWLEQIKHAPSKRALAGLFLLATAQEAAADDNANTQSFFNANYSSFNEQIQTPDLREAIHVAPNAEAFMDLIRSGYENTSDQEKLAFLSDLSRQLGRQYDYDMLAEFNSIAISEEDMFQALRNGTEAGMCGNIHTFVMKVAQQMGVESWVQFMDQGAAEDAAGHVVTGLLMEQNGKQEIVWINYGQIIDTGTDNYKDALGALESANSVRIIPVGAEGVPQSLIESAAQERIAEMIGSEPERDQTVLVPEGFNHEISPEMTSFTIKSGMLYARHSAYQNASTNQYNPLQEASYTGVGINAEVVHNDNARLELLAEVGNLNFISVNDQVGESEAHYLVGQLGYSGHLQGMTKGEYADITHKVHMLGQIQGGMMFGNTVSERFAGIQNATGSMTNEIGYTAFIDPTSNDNSFFIGASAQIDVVANDFERQDPTLWHTGTSLYAGATIKGYAGTFNISGEYTDAVAADSLSVEAGFANGNLAHSLSIEHTTLDDAIPGHNPDQTEMSYSLSQANDVFTIGITGEEGEVNEASIKFTRTF